MRENSWAKTDGRSAAIAEHKMIDGVERYTVIVGPCNSIFDSLWIERRPQIALVIAVLQEMLADTEA